MIFKYFITLVFSITLSTSLLACDCIITPISTQVKESGSVVTGKVISLLDTDKDKQKYLSQANKAYRVKFKIIRVYKGSFVKHEVIELISDFTNCDILFEKNKTYLLFLSSYKSSNSVIQCSSSDLRSKATKTIQKIKRLTT